VSSNDIILPVAVLGGLYLFRNDVSKVTGGVGTAVEGAGQGVSAAFQGTGTGISTAVTGIGTGISKSASLIPKVAREATSPLQILQTGSDVIRGNIVREDREGDVLSGIKLVGQKRSLKGSNVRTDIIQSAKSDRELIKQNQKTERERLYSSTHTNIVRSVINAPKSLKKVASKSINYIQNEQKKQQEKQKATFKKIVSGARSLKQKIFGNKIFGRG
jgi:hypothetical protein